MIHFLSINDLSVESNNDTEANRMKAGPYVWHKAPWRCVITEVEVLQNIFLARPPVLISPSTVASTCFNDTFYYVKYIILLIMDST